MKWIFTTMLLVATIAANAQYVTYNHDSPKMNQITVEETGAGALKPEPYYTLLHNKYKKTAAVKNKLTFRTAAGVASYQQVDEAEAIDSALTSRAKIEALNVADRQVDLAWLAEKDKVESQMRQFQKNIDRITMTGGSPKENERWNDYYRVYQCAIKATRDAYMPNAQRKKEYHTERGDDGGLPAKLFLLGRLPYGSKYRGIEMPEPCSGLGRLDDT